MSILQWVSAVFAALQAAGPLGPMAALAQNTATPPHHPQH